MTKNQFWVLNGTSILLAGLLLAHFYFSRSNNELGRQLNADRTAVNNGRQLQPILENMARRIAAAGETDMKLKVLLTKYDIKVHAPSSPTRTEAQPAAAVPHATKANK
jgi:hypothetical protein